ncbi:replication initiator protein A [Komagataeibacter rhaeticus]|uniref:replication initiator protein A n=1 Tax=Komagataeibacter rhaeticus TaxID=215221 RepID=UPI001F0A59F2|nr:replication initiator protein A [Komagataeibacter rhaeticus]GBQ13327.1 plasmid replication initiator RepA [Komagataeibacter rhaeticus DSM 16663]
MAGVMPQRGQHGRESERLRLAPFVIAGGDASPRDQRDLMERPFFSLSKAKRVAPILYEASGQRVEIHGLAEHGMATIWDADVLIWAASQIVEAENGGLRTSRFLRFTPYQLLTAVGRTTGARDYRLLKAAFARLQSTVIRTTIRNGEHWRRHQFSWINEWEERTTRDGRVEGMECVLPDWFYRGVIDRSLVLTIDPAYFRLTGGIERWLYRVARKHAGHQPQGWLFEIPHLHEKSGSLARVSDYAPAAGGERRAKADRRRRFQPCVERGGKHCLQAWCAARTGRDVRARPEPLEWLESSPTGHPSRHRQIPLRPRCRTEWQGRRPSSLHPARRYRPRR